VRGLGPRRIAEWVSFGVSLALIVVLAAHLVWRMVEPPPEAIEASVTPLLDQVVQQEGRYVVPFAVQNASRRTVRHLQIRIRYEVTQGQEEQMDVLLDYLGEASTQTVYAYFRQDPRTLSIRAEPISYSRE